MSKNEIKERARKVLENTGFRPGQSVWSDLRSFPWDFSKQSSASVEVTSPLVMSLDPGCCFGKTVLAGLIAEAHGVDVQFGEVRTDYLRNFMIHHIMRSLAGGTYEESMLIELLMYEEPHSVILFDGEIQFDPISVVLRETILHPVVKEFPFWDAVLSAVVIAESFLEQDLRKRLDMIDKADRVCPGTSLVLEARAAHSVLTSDPGASDLILHATELRPTAAMFYALIELGRREGRTALEACYGRATAELIIAHYNKELAGVSTVR